MGARFLLCCLFWLICMASLPHTFADQLKKPFSCIGGSIYFTAHPVDGLLYQNPDLLHDLYVFKCITTVVMTSGDRGMGSNFSLSLERGLQEAYISMADLPIDDPTKEEAIVKIGTHDVQSWSLRGMPNIQIIYLRLPDGSASGHGYNANKGMSLSKLYHNKIDSMTSTDGKVTYTLRDLKELISFILQARKANEVRILDHKARLPEGEDHHQMPSDHHASDHHWRSEHSDHIVSAKLVQGAINRDKIKVAIRAYAGNLARKLDSSIKTSDSDFARKVSAFLKYAMYDEFMCKSLEECLAQLTDAKADDETRYVSQYLQREYIVL